MQTSFNDHDIFGGLAKKKIVLTRVTLTVAVPSQNLPCKFVSQVKPSMRNESLGIV